jgi:hypothetical protein
MKTIIKEHCMKKTIKLNAIQRIVGIIAIAAVIGLAFTACEGPEGPTGPRGPAGGQGQPRTAKVVDAAGKEIGKSISGSTVSNGSYTFPVNMTTGEISGITLYATELNGGGTLVYYYSGYPNYIMMNNGDFYRCKNRDAEGYATDVSTVTSNSSLSSTSSSWYNYTSTGTYVEIEKIEGATITSIIGFVPTPPCRYEW